MPDTRLQTPVLFLIFNRPDTTLLVFEKIREQQPRYLYIAADGPREDKPGDALLCKQCRDLVHMVDWHCEVKTLFRETNLGSKYAVSSAITWLFQNEETGIILEDDCVPNGGFFFFCETLLMKFKDDTHIMHITGANLNDNIKFGEGSYYYSNYANVWGWATWRRAWNNFDLELTDIDAYNEFIKLKIKHFSERFFWQSRINLIKSNLIDAWDYQWMLSILKAGGICLNSNYNLVTNIGFGHNSTHTTGNSPYITPDTQNLTVISHPVSLTTNNKADAIFIKTLHGIKRKSYFSYYMHQYLIQRCINLLHKIKINISRYVSN